MATQTGKNVPIINGYANGDNGWGENMNLALRLIESMCLPVAMSVSTATPPASPAEGDMYIVAASPTGAWAGKAGYLARYSKALSAWDLIPPKSGWRVWAQDAGSFYVYNGSAWVEDNAWISGAGAPSGSTGNVGNFYLDTNTGNFYKKTGTSTWTLQGSLTGTHTSKVVALGNITGAVTIDLTQGSIFTGTLTGNVTFTWTGLPASGYIADFELRLTQDATGGRTATWPANGKWPGGAVFALTPTASALDVVGVEVDSAGNWIGYPMEAVA